MSASRYDKLGRPDPAPAKTHGRDTDAGGRPDYMNGPRPPGRSWGFWPKFAVWVIAMVILALLLSQIFVGCYIPLPNELAESPTYGYVEPPLLDTPEGAVAYQGPGVPVALAQPVNPVAYSTDSILRGEEGYDIYCRLCHGAVEATGPGPVGELFEPPPPILAERAPSLADGQIYSAVSNGFGRMPALAWNMEEDQRWHIVNYIRSVTTGEPEEPADAQARAALNYTVHCATCHGPAGRGALGPALFPSAFLTEARPEEIADIILAGRTGRGMPSFSGYLGSEEANSLADLLKRLQEEGPSAILDSLDGLQVPGEAPGPGTTSTEAASTTTTSAPGAPPTDATTTTEEGGGDDLVSEGAEVFANNCATCHGPEGGGGVGPQLNPNEYVQQSTDAELQQLIGGGRGGMPAFEGRLTDLEIEAVIAFLRSWQDSALGGELPSNAGFDRARWAHRTPRLVSDGAGGTAEPLLLEREGGGPPVILAQAQPELDLEAAGQTFQANCAGCHGDEGREGGVGPALQPNQFVQENPPDAVRGVIANGRGAMPAWEGRLTDAEIDALVALLQSWQEGAAPGPETTEAAAGTTEPGTGTTAGGADTTQPGTGPTDTQGGSVTTEAAPPAGVGEGEFEELPFSHRAHVSRGMACTFCHAPARRGPAAGIPPLELCAGCHRYLTTQNERTEQIVSAFDEERQNVGWYRVYDQPDYVVFNHRSHVLVAGVDCSRCHGDVGGLTVVRSEAVDMNMGFCLDCHRSSAYGLYEGDPEAGISGSLLGRDLPEGEFLAGCGICHG